MVELFQTRLALACYSIFFLFFTPHPMPEIRFNGQIRNCFLVSIANVQDVITAVIRLSDAPSQRDFESYLNTIINPATGNLSNAVVIVDAAGNGYQMLNIAYDGSKTYTLRSIGALRAR